MGLSEVLHYLEEEKERLLAGAADISDLYRSLAESIRTLPVPFRLSFAPDSGINAAIDPESSKIVFQKHGLQSSEGEVQDNTRRLAALINNVYAIRNSFMSNAHFVELKEIAEIRKVHADIRQFLEELYLKNTVWILQDPNSEASVLARQKRKDIEEILKERIDPFFERLEQIRIDEYSLRLRMEIRDEIGSAQNYRKSPEKHDALIKDRCNRLGVPYDPKLAKLVIQDLEQTDGHLETRLREKYESVDKPADSPSTRRKYMRILHRYLARTKDVAALLPILENIYFLFQPKPSFLERIRCFLARLAGREEKTTRRDIEYSYIIGGQSIERKQASLEKLIGEVNQLEKNLLRVRDNVRTAQINKKIKTIPVSSIAETIDSIRSSMRRVFEESFGIVQWLGKKSNQDKLAKLPETMQRDLNVHLDAIYATIIINAERLKEILRRDRGIWDSGG
ncbi:MAG: hypothetical protein JXB06_04265 [Spirochaetales bacterium]|nr:hypothetical protein [Spirochaetales bacterium]